MGAGEVGSRERAALGGQDAGDWCRVFSRQEGGVMAPKQQGQLGAAVGTVTSKISWKDPEVPGK